MDRVSFTWAEIVRSDVSRELLFLTLTWSVMLQMVITVSLASRKSCVAFSPTATEQRVSRLLSTTSLSALLKKQIKQCLFFLNQTEV